MSHRFTLALLARAARPTRTLALLAAGGLAACNSGATSPTSAATTALAATTGTIATASDLSTAPELADLMRGLVPDHIRDGVEGFRCDTTPTIANTTVCGKTFPTSIQLDWTACAERPMRPHDHHGDGAGGAATSTTTTASTSDGSSAGTVSIEQTVAATPADTCDGTEQYDITRTSKSDVTDTHPDGTSDHLVANVSSDSVRTPSAQTFSQTKTYDLTRTDLDATGATTRVTHTTGAIAEAFDGSGATPTRTLDGTLTRDDGTTTTTLTVTGVVFGAPDACRWPIAGTIVEALPDGTTHTLAFGATCGDATLDGVAVTLPEHGPHLGPAGHDEDGLGHEQGDDKGGRRGSGDHGASGAGGGN
jgi:hypothetical protein